MNKILCVIVCLLLIVFISLNIKLLLNKKECIYSIDETYYTENIKVGIKHFDDLIIEKKYQFNDKDIMKLEIEELEKLNYKLNIENNIVIATKVEKNSSYFKNIKKYKELGFVCK